MKVKELIAALKAADPTGDCEVVTNTAPYWVSRNDIGKMSMIAGADKVKGPYKGPALCKETEQTYVITDSDDKVIIDILQLETVMHNNPGIFVYVETRDPASETFLSERVKELRNRCIDYRTRVSPPTSKINEQLSKPNRPWPHKEG